MKRLIIGIFIIFFLSACGPSGGQTDKESKNDDSGSHPYSTQKKVLDNAKAIQDMADKKAKAMDDMLDDEGDNK